MCACVDLFNFVPLFHVSLIFIVFSRQFGRPCETRLLESMAGWPYSKLKYRHIVTRHPKYLPKNFTPGSSPVQGKLTSISRSRSKQIYLSGLIAVMEARISGNMWNDCRDEGTNQDDFRRRHCRYLFHYQTS